MSFDGMSEIFQALLRDDGSIRKYPLVLEAFLDHKELQDVLENLRNTRIRLRQIIKDIVGAYRKR